MAAGTSDAADWPSSCSSSDENCEKDEKEEGNAEPLSAEQKLLRAERKKRGVCEDCGERSRNDGLPRQIGAPGWR
eukprot:SAG11_NODE_22322_length_408_cov_0.770227_1_plen_74_part_10